MISFIDTDNIRRQYTWIKLLFHLGYEKKNKYSRTIDFFYEANIFWELIATGEMTRPDILLYLKNICSIIWDCNHTLRCVYVLKLFSFCFLCNKKIKTKHPPPKKKNIKKLINLLKKNFPKNPKYKNRQPV